TPPALRAARPLAVGRVTQPTLALETIIDDAITVIVDAIAALGGGRLFPDAWTPCAALALSLTHPARSTTRRGGWAGVAALVALPRTDATGRPESVQFTVLLENRVRIGASPGEAA